MESEANGGPLSLLLTLLNLCNLFSFFFFLYILLFYFYCCFVVRIQRALVFHTLMPPRKWNPRPMAVLSLLLTPSLLNCVTFSFFFFFLFLFFFLLYNFILFLFYCFCSAHSASASLSNTLMPPDGRGIRGQWRSSLPPSHSP